MDSGARVGQRILVAVAVVYIVGELTTSVLQLLLGEFKTITIARVLFTTWFVIKAWEGAGWARWLLCVCSILAAMLGVASSVALPIERSEFGVLIAGFGVVHLMTGLGLASPWVGAYQSYCRNLMDTDSEGELTE